MYSRTLLLGDTPEVRAQAAGQAQPHHLSMLLSHYDRVEVGPAPPPCGLRLAKHYRGALPKRFSIFPLSACSESPTSVNCPSETLSTTPAIFLRFRYTHEDGKLMQMTLAAYQRGATGDVSEIQIPRDYRLAFSELWDELVEVTQCSEP